MSKRSNMISRLSPRALLIGICNEFSETPFSYGTCFLVETKIGICLLTARHCVTGRHHHNSTLLDPNGSIPHSLNVFHRTSEDGIQLSSPAYIKGERLYNADGSPRWFEHPTLRDLCDFVVLPLSDYADCFLCLVNLQPGLTELTKAGPMTDSRGFILDPANGMALHVADKISVIGYLYAAVTRNILPLWSTGYLASEPNLDHGLGNQYIDCRARGGQSGSPVYAYASGAYEAADGNGVLFDGYAYMFLGLYSGRINKSSDIGVIWEAQTLLDTVSAIDQMGCAQAPTERVLPGPITFMRTLSDQLS